MMTWSYVHCIERAIDIMCTGEYSWLAGLKKTASSSSAETPNMHCTSTRHDHQLIEFTPPMLMGLRGIRLRNPIS